MTINRVTREELAREYCTRQDAEPADLLARLDGMKTRFACEGFMLLECQMMDSSMLGSYTILPYGGDATFKTIPDHPISPRGLASDMSTVAMVSD